MRFLITGGAGCIGSELAVRLVRDGNQVRVYDNFSNGRREHLKEIENNKNLEIIEGDILDLEFLSDSMKGVDAVFHLAAISSAKRGEDDATDPEVRINILGTYNVLEAMRQKGVKKILFTSTSAVYGNSPEIPSGENSPLFPVSMYAASKAACEHLIQGFCSMFDMQCWIFRLANVVGGKNRKNGTNILTDFIRKLQENPHKLEILGDGAQKKSYVAVEDGIGAMLFCFKKSKDSVNIFNVATGDAITVKEIASIVTEEMNLKNVSFKYTGGNRGWKGDVPITIMDVSKLAKLGWNCKYMSKDAVRLSIREALRGS